MKLKDSIRYIKGVGPAKEELFNKVEIKTVEDLINYFPRDYEDRTIVKKLFEVTDGEKVSFEAEIHGNIGKVTKGIAKSIEKKDIAKRNQCMQLIEPLLILCTGLYILILVETIVLPFLTSFGGIS